VNKYSGNLAAGPATMEHLLQQVAICLSYLPSAMNVIDLRFLIVIDFIRKRI